MYAVAGAGIQNPKLRAPLLLKNFFFEKKKQKTFII
jgi:hypothetical protein